MILFRLQFISLNEIALDKGEIQWKTLRKFKKAILALSETDYQLLRQWLNELDKDEWDRQIETDSNAGKLDFLIVEALEAQKEGTLKNLEDL